MQHVKFYTSLFCRLGIGLGLGSGAASCATQPIDARDAPDTDAAISDADTPDADTPDADTPGEFSRDWQRPEELCPEPPLGHGLAYDSLPEAGVRCNEAICSVGNVCCLANIDYCTDAAACGFGERISCDGPEDCPGQVCCSGSCTEKVECEDSQGNVACNTTSDCASGTFCVADASREATLDRGYCRAGVVAACEFGPEGDCSCSDLTDVDLYGRVLQESSLYGTDLSDANVNQSDLSGSDLRYANLSGSGLASTNLFRANLTGAHLKDAALNGTNLNEAELAGAYLAGGIDGTSFDRANLESVVIDGAFLNRVSMVDTRLEQARFIDSMLVFVDFTGADLTSTSFVGTHGFRITCPDGWLQQDNLETICEGHLTAVP